MEKQKSHLEQEFKNRESFREAVRLNKYISESGFCSRREADRLIDAGRVFVDGQKAEPGWKVKAGQQVLVDGKPLDYVENMVLLAFHKPRGVVCTTDKRWGDTTVEEVLHYPTRVFPMGRLDKESEGLLLMTNNGDILNKMMRGGNYHEKEYIVTVNRPITQEFLKGMAKGGIPVLNQRTRPCKIRKISDITFGIILTQGLNRQIRRMCEAAGMQVTRLLRIREGNLSLGELPSGAWRYLTPEEVQKLR